MGFIKRTFRNIFKRSSSNQNRRYKAPQARDPLTTSLEENIEKVKNTLGNSTDLVVREFRIGTNENIKAAVIYTDGLADTTAIQDFIMKSLMLDLRETNLYKKDSSRDNLFLLLKNFALTIPDLKEVQDFDSLFTSVLSGDTVILIDGYPHGLVAATGGWEDRGVQEPTAQTVVRGPREGFSENIRTNTALIRRKIKDPNLWLETRKIGRVTKTNVAVMYIKGIANDKIVAEVRARLDRIDIDGILESGYIEELIQDETYTPFPTVFNTERPDAAAAGLLEGRVAILVDGTPFVLLVPALFIQYFQASEDYYHRSDFGLIRLLRMVSLFIALLGPSLFIALTTFHQEMIPTVLLISLAAQREGVPFPAFVQALMMEITFEILREAGVRMPRAVGQAVSIVGALVIGQAAVEAGMVAPAMVIVVSITAITGFVFPSFNMGISIRILRFGLMFIAANFGLFGITVGLIAIVLHLCSLRSFGIPYMTPFAPFILADQKDSIFRLPHWGLFSRPRLISQKNMIREQNPPTTKPTRKPNH